MLKTKDRINYITSRLWNPVGDSGKEYSVDIRGIIKDMKRVHYPIYEIPEEFIEKYPNEYFDYVKFIIQNDASQIKFLPEEFQRVLFNENNKDSSALNEDNEFSKGM